MASSGPNSPGTTGDDSGVGTVTWSNTSNITSSNDSRATAALAGAAVSHYLTATNFGFAIPDGATIDGIVVEWERCLAAGTDCRDSRARLILDGAVGSTDRAAGGNWPAVGSEAYASYGSSSDLWGESPTPTSVNASNFGAALAATSTAGGSAAVDHCRVTVYYTPAPAGAAAGRPLRQTRSRSLLRR